MQEQGPEFDPQKSCFKKWKIPDVVMCICNPSAEEPETYPLNSWPIASERQANERLSQTSRRWHLKDESSGCPVASRKDGCGGGGEKSELSPSVPALSPSPVSCFPGEGGVAGTERDTVTS